MIYSTLVSAYASVPNCAINRKRRVLRVAFLSYGSILDFHGIDRLATVCKNDKISPLFLVLLGSKIVTIY